MIIDVKAPNTRKDDIRDKVGKIILKGESDQDIEFLTALSKFYMPSGDEGYVALFLYKLKTLEGVKKGDVKPQPDFAYLRGIK